MAVDATMIEQRPAAPRQAAVQRRRGGFRSLVLLLLGLLCAVIGQLYLIRQRYPLDGVIFYLVAVLLFWRAVRDVGLPIGLPDALPRQINLLFMLPGVVLGVAAFLLFRQGGTGANLGLVLWLLGMLALVAVYWRQGLSPEGSIRLQNWEWIALGLVLLLGLFLRLYQLSAFPATLYLDEGDAGVAALRLWRTPTYTAYIPDITGQPTTFFYGLGLFIKVLGVGVQTMRLYTILIGMLGVAALYFLGRELLGPQAAIIAAFFSAVSSWSINFSRVVFTTSLIPLAVALTMFLLLRALRTRRALDFVWCGLSVGLGMGTYLPYRVVPLLVVLYIGYKVIGNRSFLRSHLAGLAVMVVAAFIAFIPLGVHYMRQPSDLWSRARAASVQQDIDREKSLAPLYANIRKTIGMFNYQGDPRPRHNLPHSPMLDPLTATFLVLGFGLALLKWRKAENSMVITWLILGAIPGVFSLADSNPHSSRTITNLPAVCLLAALGVERTWSFLRQRYGAQVWRNLLPVSLALALVVLALNFNVYFNRQAKDKNVYYDFDPVQTQVAQTVAARSRSNQVLVASAFTNHSAVKFLDDGLAAGVFNQTTHLPLRDVSDRDTTFILEPAQQQLVTLLRQYYPDAQVTEWRDRYGNPGYYEITVTRDQATTAHGVTASYYQGGQTGASPTIEHKTETIAADWAAAPLEPPFAVVWRSALFVSRNGPHALTLESSEPASVTLDSQVVVETTGGVASVSLSLYGGFHSLEVSASVTRREGSTTLRWRTPDGSEQVIPSSALFTVDVARNGLLGKYYRGNAWAGTPAVQQKDLFIFPNDVLPAPFSIEWEGKIYAPQDGQYVFGTLSDDGSLLYIDNKLVVDNGGHHSDRYVEGRAVLTQGLHDIRLRYFQDDGGRLMDLYWIPPGGRKEIVPSGALFPPNTVLSGPIALPTQAPLPTVVPPAARTPAVPSAGRTPAVQPPVVSSIGQMGPVKIIGGEGSGPGQFRNPRGVAVDSQGRIYVADTGNKRVQVLDSQGKFLAEWKSGREAFAEPIAIAIGPTGDVYVLDAERDGAYVFSANGQYRAKIGEGLGLYRPRGLAIDSSGTLYFANTGGNNVVRTLANGQPQGAISKQGKRDGELEQPTDVAVDASGNVFVADTYNQRIQRFTADGRYVKQWSIPASGTAVGPHLAMGADGVLYVTDPDNSVVTAYSTEGAILATWGGQGMAEGQLVQPVGIAIDGGGLLYIADSGNNRIQVWGKQ